jgi:hypothetical protein
MWEEYEVDGLCTSCLESLDCESEEGSESGKSDESEWIDEDDGEEIDDSEWDDESDDDDDKGMEDHEIEESDKGITNGPEEIETTENMAVTIWGSQTI